MNVRTMIHNTSGKSLPCQSHVAPPLAVRGATCSARSPSAQPAALCSNSWRQAKKTTRTASAVAEAAREEQAGIAPVEQGTWHAVVANADFMLHDVQNESFAEQLRERRRLFSDKKQPLDFWLVPEPAWLDEQFPSEAKRIGRPCVALVSTDEIWINFMKLRLDRVMRLELGEKTLAEVLKANAPPPTYEPLDRKGKWTAPYPPYRPGWWEVFMPKAGQ